jgi:hypothetical protein
MLMATAACGVDDGGKTETVNPNPLAIQCTDAFKVTGTFTASTARPTDNPSTPNVDEAVLGCWPAGTWTFSLALDPGNENILDINGDKLPDRCGQVAGTAAATFKQSCSFTVTRADDGNGYVDAYTVNGGGFAADCSQAGECVARLKVSEGGARECEGGFEIYSADRKEYWNLKPEQASAPAPNAGGLDGVGEYTRYNAPQVP